MQKTHCNIIKDLMPSYIDELCSEESKQLVEEHFKECNNCKKLYEQTSLETIPGTPATASKEIDYFKNIRKKVTTKNDYLLYITAVLFFFQLYFNFNQLLRIGYSQIILYGNAIFLLLIALALFPTLPDFTEHPVPNKIKLPILGIEFGIMTGMFTYLAYVCYYSLTYDGLPFGMQPKQFGPFIITLITVFGAFYIIAFVATLIISLRKKTICPALCILPIGGFSLISDYAHLLTEYSGNVHILSFIQPYGIVMAEVILALGIYMFVTRKKTF